MNTWTRASVELPDSNRFVQFVAGGELRAGCYEFGRWWCCCGDAIEATVSHWTEAPTLPEDLE